MAEVKKSSSMKLWIYLAVIIVLAAGVVYLVLRNSASADVATASQNSSRSTIIKGVVMNQSISSVNTPIKLKVTDGLKGMVGRTITVNPTLKGTTYSIVSANPWTTFYYSYDYRLRFGSITKGTKLVISGVMNGINSMSVASIAEERVSQLRNTPKWVEPSGSFYQTIAEGVVTEGASRNGNGVFKLKVDKGIANLLGQEIVINPVYNFSTYSIMSTARSTSAEYGSYLDKLSSSELKTGTRLLIAGKFSYQNSASSSGSKYFIADQIVELGGAGTTPTPVSSTVPPVPDLSPSPVASAPVGYDLIFSCVASSGQCNQSSSDMAVINVGEEITLTAKWPKTPSGELNATVSNGFAADLTIVSKTTDSITVKLKGKSYQDPDHPNQVQVGDHINFYAGSQSYRYFMIVTNQQ